MAQLAVLPLQRQIAGVKVPKGLRKSGRSVAGLFGSPLGREVLADALVAAAAAAATLVRNRPSAEEVKDASAAVGDAGKAVAVTAKDVAEAAIGAVGGVVAGAARQVLSGSLAGADGTGARERRASDAAYAVLADRADKKPKQKHKPSKH